MRQVLVSAVFMLATLGWAQQPSTSPQPSAGQATSSSSSSQPSAGQATSPSSPAAGASQSQSPVPGSAGQGSAQTAPGAQTPATNKPITEGCLGGSDPNFTITDKAGTTYKLILPPKAVSSALTPHVGESVLVMGDVMAASGSGNASSINVLKMGRGNGSCAGSNSKPPKP